MRIVHAYPPALRAAWASLVRVVLPLLLFVPVGSAPAANRLTIPSLTLPAGAGGQRVHVRCEHDIVLSAFSLVIGYPPELVEIAEASVADTSAEGADFVSIVRRDGAIVYNVVLDTGLPFSKYLPPGQDHTLARLTVNLLPAAVAGTTADLVFRNGFDDGHHVYDNILSDEGGASVSPSRGTAPASGRITVAAEGAAIPPTANAGPDVTVAEGAEVRLDASGSQSPTGETLAYSWVQASGPQADLSGADTAQASLVFPAPVVPSDSKAVFRVTATGATSGLQDSDDVSVTVVDLGSRTPACSAAATTQGLIDGGARVVLFQGAIDWPSTAEDANWSLLRFTASGPGKEPRLLSNVRLYADGNGDESFGDDDVPLGDPVPVVKNDGEAEFRFFRRIPEGSSVTYFLVADVIPGPQVSGSLALPLLGALGAALLASALRGRCRRGLLVPLCGAMLAAGMLVTACDDGGSSGPLIREVQFDIEDPSDVALQGAATGVFLVPEGLPLTGPLIEV